MDQEKPVITVEGTVKDAIEKVWAYYTEPAHIMGWNFAAPEWHCPRAENDLREGGSFSYTMAARDGSAEFDFAGTYDEVKKYAIIRYHLGDARRVTIVFEDKGDNVDITVSFEAESMNPIDMQQAGWQAILNNFITYTESH